MFILRRNIFADLPDFVRASNRVIVAAAITVGASGYFRRDARRRLGNEQGSIVLMLPSVCSLKRGLG
jgi:hypothetical protein